MAASTQFVQLPLIRMVDLAITTDGAVNFPLLQTILYAIIQKTNAQEIAVEIHGAEAAKLQEQLRVVPEKPTFMLKEAIDRTPDGKEQSVYVVSPDTAYQGTSSVAKEKIDDLEGEVHELKKELQDLRDLPGNMGIIGAVKNFEDKSSTVIDVFHMLSLQKRVQAAEEAMVKVATIVEDLIKSPIGLSLDTRNVICQKDQDRYETDGETTSRSTLKDEVMPIEEDFAGEVSRLPLGEQVLKLILEVSELKKNFGMQENSLINQLVRDAESRQSGKDGLPDNIVDDRYKDMYEHLEHLDISLNEAILRLHNQLTDLELDFNYMHNRVDMGVAPPGEIESNSGLQQKVAQLQIDFGTLNNTSVKLIEDRDEKTKMLDVMWEQIEILKTIKADREDIEEALADKADACSVLRKVSHEQFDNACEELSKNIEDALDKLTQQELLWQQALEDLQSEIGNKLDKMDLGPLREFINNKLKLLQDKMKSLAALKREQEAAGTKNKLLRDVTCISCDKNVVMKKEYDLSFRPITPKFPPTRSMAPYLAFELDALRKQQKSIPGGKNLRNFEAALQGKILRRKVDDHICNRYCGGSHTLTTPQQRVTRLGHFLMQWGPEAQPSEIVPKNLQGPSVRPQVIGDMAETSKRLNKLEESKRASKTSELSKGSKKKNSEKVNNKKLASGSSKVSVNKDEKPKGGMDQPKASTARVYEVNDTQKITIPGTELEIAAAGGAEVIANNP